MNCWHCGHEVIWCGDHDLEEESETHSILTNMYCHNCGSDYDIYYPKEREKDE